MNLEVTFTDRHILFPVSHLSRLGGTFNGTLAASAIQDADPATAPPEIRAVSGETLFVSAVQREQLERFCQANQIPIHKRPDVWGDLLEPFIDTEFTPECEAVTLSRLRQAGLSDTEVDQIRASVRPLMLAYNAILWDWFHLGLADLLQAVTADWLCDLRGELGETAGFYAWAMRIAARTGRLDKALTQEPNAP